MKILIDMIMFTKKMMLLLGLCDEKIDLLADFRSQLFFPAHSESLPSKLKNIVCQQKHLSYSQILIVTISTLLYKQYLDNLSSIFNSLQNLNISHCIVLLCSLFCICFKNVFRMLSCLLLLSQSLAKLHFQKL